MQVARAMEGAVCAVELYEGPLTVLDEMEAYLQVEEDPLVKATLERREATRKTHQAMAAGRSSSKG